MEEYVVMQELWITNGKGFLLVFAINDYDSFKDLNNIYTKIMRIKNTQKVHIVLVGNKCDLEE